VWNKDDSTLTVSEAPVADKAEKPAVDSVPVVAQNSAKTTVNEVAEPKKTEPKKDPAKNRSQQEVIKTVVIDAGHGGIDPGAIGPDGHQEKEIVLDVALQLRDIMKKQSDITVYLTRDHDIFIPLQDRTRFANRKKADLFVSIHANSIDGDERKKESAKGFKVYFLSQAKNEDDKMVAMRENAVIKLEDKTNRYDNLQNILIDMVGNEYLRESQDFSIMIAESFHSKLKQIPKLNLGVGQANFWVLNGAYMPSVLIEVGFISNKKEEEHLKDAATQQTIAQGIFEAIMNLRSKFESD
jgi:N-acetylmuramoyl-L-alanine amidase